MKKHSIWLTISTLVLCLGVMAFGVYSAISAALNVNGTLSFNMQNCMVTISGTISNVAEMNQTSANPTNSTRTIERTVMGGEGTATTNINIGNLFFFEDDNIVFELTFTNIHSKSVKATLPKPTVGEGVTVLHNDTTNGYVDFTNAYETTISANASTTIKFALQLTDEAMRLYDSGFNWTGITFEEYIEPLIKSDTVTNSIDSDNGSTYYYIEMGTNPTTGDPLRWVPFAVYDEDAGDYTTFSKNDKPEEGKTYYFISEYVLDLYIDSTATSAYGISYGYYASSDTTTAVYYVNGTPTTTSGIQPNDYSVSNIRSYLNGGEAYKCRDTSNNYYALTTEAMTGENAFATYFGLTSDPIYTGNYITSRPLTGAKDGATFSLYSDLSATTATTRPTAESSFTATEKASTSDKDKLWLPSYFEIYNYYGNKASSGNAVYKASRLTTQGASTQTAGNWWLRTPLSSYAPYAFNVTTSGNLINHIVYYSSGAARPAFQISIPA